MDDLEKERQRMIKELKECIAQIAALQKEYNDCKKEHPEFRIEMFEESEPPQGQTGQG
ncbi:MAG: hypothetical protein LBF74_07395 [Treponema sp.]|nr:hypothetical protein [Treponema sp.]